MLIGTTTPKKILKNLFPTIIIITKSIKILYSGQDNPNLHHIDSSITNIFTDIAFDRSIVPSRAIDNWMYVSSVAGQIFQVNYERYLL